MNKREMEDFRARIRARALNINEQPSIDPRCYCGHTQGNHNNEGTCPLSAIAYQYARFPGDDYCKCEGFVIEQPSTPPPASGAGSEWRVVNLGRNTYIERDGESPFVCDMQTSELSNAERLKARALAEQIVQRYHQHSTLVEQRKRLVETLKSLGGYAAALEMMVDAKEEGLPLKEAWSVLTTIEQEEETR